MQRTILDLLLCPTCKGKLVLETLTSNGAIDNGTLSCHACQINYPIQRGIPHFIKLRFSFSYRGINFFSNKQKAIDEMIRVAKPGTKIIVCDENENGAQWYEKFLPGFKSTFHGQREAVTAPIDLIPKAMLDIHLENIWNGYFYCLEFRKPFKIN